MWPGRGLDRAAKLSASMSPIRPHHSGASGVARFCGVAPAPRGNGSALLLAVTWWQHFARVQQVLRVQRLLDGPHHPERFAVFF